MEEQNKHTIEELKENINIFLNKEFSNNRLIMPGSLICTEQLAVCSMLWIARFS